MTFDEFFQTFLSPFGPAPTESFVPRDQSDNKYVFPEDVFGATELLSGSLIALPGKHCLEGVNTGDAVTLEREIQKAWVGGYVSGREWALVNIGVFLAMMWEDGDSPMMQAMAAHDWDETASQPELRHWFVGHAIAFLTRLKMQDASKT